MRQPGFEPGLGAWGAPVLDQTGPQPQEYPSNMGQVEAELRFSTHAASSQLTEKHLYALNRFKEGPNGIALCSGSRT